ncbi:MAG: hydrogenase maturation nickel metallochaperone HypA [Desulfovibrio sp.]|nr:hydrogenase maturation nickel metallochaperone HypA [Desulfovibrio sp.]
MHEASLVQGLLNLVERTVEEHNAQASEEQKIRHVQEIICELGLYSCVEPRTLTSCFELLAENTLADGAQLTVRKAPLTCHCQDCGNSFTVTERQFHCPACGGENIHFDGGHGLMLISLRVDTEE